MTPSLKTTALAAVLLVAVGGSAWQVWGNSAAAAPAAATPPVSLSVNLTTPTRSSWPQTLQASGTLMAWQDAVIGAETGSLRITELLRRRGAAASSAASCSRASPTTA